MNRLTTAGSLLLTLALVACAARPAEAPSTQSSASSGPDTLKVAATFYPLAFFARQVGGNLVSVTQVTPGGMEPHDFEPSPRQIAAAHDAKVFLMNGGGVDAWGDKLIDDLKQSGIVTLRMTDTIAPMGGFSDGGEMDPTKPSPANTNVPDPHIWLDPVLAAKEAALIRDAFTRADPAHAGQYAAQAGRFILDLAQLDKDYRDGLAHCAEKTAVVSHNAFRYLAKEYGFTTLAIAGLDPEQESSPERVAQLSDFARKNGIRYIFFETLANPKIAQTVAGEIGAQALVLNPIEGLTNEDVAKGDNYLTLMEKNLQNLRTALQCQ